LVVHFWASWNGVDRRYNPELAPVQERFGGRVVFRSADVDDPAHAPLIEQCRLVNEPTVAGLVAGECVGTVIGLRTAAELMAWVGEWVRRAGRPIDPRWRTADVLGLARGMAGEGALDRLPILADALMDAGCADERILAPCRNPGPAPAGWWLVDLVLAKE
jgi:thioredoxin-like negative regulator of GroEL